MIYEASVDNYLDADEGGIFACPLAVAYNVAYSYFGSYSAADTRPTCFLCDKSCSILTLFCLSSVTESYEVIFLLTCSGVVLMKSSNALLPFKLLFLGDNSAPLPPKAANSI